MEGTAYCGWLDIHIWVSCKYVLFDKMVIGSLAEIIRKVDITVHYFDPSTWGAKVERL